MRGGWPVARAWALGPATLVPLLHFLAGPGDSVSPAPWAFRSVPGHSGMGGVSTRTSFLTSEDPQVKKNKCSQNAERTLQRLKRTNSSTGVRNAMPTRDQTKRPSH